MRLRRSAISVSRAVNTRSSWATASARASMRAALQLALEHEALEHAGLLEEEVFRRGHRRLILRRTAAPLEPVLGRAGFERLLKALSVIYGIEIYVVLKDIWGASDREVEALARWMLDTIVTAALDDAKRTRARPTDKSRLVR
jgi:hypothetical protein